ncbi:phosphonate C-P lyase system protein PhnG [Brevibacterium sp. ACRRH]|uniref:phosphonate C-P lyase system protein PhnG n=1 Tax=Brevibacterium sp. ACRRH TaxID=2918183 RepID=UPI001EF402B6|nr:phosphonate C-P lyase system protein PhnG [Brevibacterium sp. ACRRH]MCG7298916.1 phosphonate C-P lyase system protein PhnG [Brevibacterium sp. ACRRH]
MNRSPNEYGELWRRSSRVLANTEVSTIEKHWSAWESRCEVEQLRSPEVGMVMVQGRAGGVGDRFNLGEATVSRATVAVALDGHSKTVGNAYVLGSDVRHAELIAIFNALLVGEGQHRVLSEVVEPLERDLAKKNAEKHATAQSTLVEFFTVARESQFEDEED